MDVSTDASIHMGHLSVPVYKTDTNLTLMEPHALVSHDDIIQYSQNTLSGAIISTCQSYNDPCCNPPFPEINECAEGIHNCDQNCHNTDGSYTCSCRQGYQLARDGHTCLGEITLILYTLSMCMHGVAFLYSVSVHIM